MNGLQRYLLLTGMSAKTISPQVVDPTSQINVQVQAICIQLGIPQRIFMGSERGELASSQDEGTWNDRLRDRQNNYVTPRIIVPFIDRLIAIGVLPQPVEYFVVWPDLYAMTEAEQASVAVARTNAMAAYVAGNVEAMMTPLDYMVRVLGMSEEEAGSTLQAAVDAVAKEEAVSPGITIPCFKFRFMSSSLLLAVCLQPV